MALAQRLISLDETLSKSKLNTLDENGNIIKSDIVFINDLPNNTEEERREIFEKVTTQYMNGDKISMLPQCKCGMLKGENFVKTANKAAALCRNCGTEVKSSIESAIQSVIWFKKPEGILKLMAPVVFTMIQERFTKQGWDVIMYQADASYKSDAKDTTFMVKIREKNFPRGWNNFIVYFDQIMEFLFSLKEFNTNFKKGEIDFLPLLLKRDKDKIFCDSLPLPNRSMFVFENTNMGIYRNDATGKAMTFISLMMSIDRNIQPLTQRIKENRIARLYDKMSEYSKEHIKNDISPKTGSIRRNTIATKNTMAYRSVVTSIAEPWDYNAIKVPWTVGLTMFRPMLVNKLMRYGMSQNKAVDFLMAHTGRYNSLLHKFLNELIEEAPEGKIWCTIQRNPSLKQGSIQLVYIGGFKTDPGDKTTGMPLPIVKAPNAKKLACFTGM